MEKIDKLGREEWIEIICEIWEDDRKIKDKIIKDSFLYCGISWRKKYWYLDDLYFRVFNLLMEKEEEKKQKKIMK